MKNIIAFLSENFQFLEAKFSIYLNRRVFVMSRDLGKYGNSYPRFVHGLAVAKASDISLETL